MNEGHVLGPNCPCAKTLVGDGHPHKCSCGGYYHLFFDQDTTSIACDVCGKDRDAYKTGEIRV